ncbi:hypothetical protein BGZ99_000236 [Dissophora globulifera]|uniref:F-box domain-containing protein n=1 Tax=Dissophora globulifera TaxID=979702 RepID=A0A9P6RPW4_9FUNG|nr:hypothetical protein BGZ99_000236 [Dissophora globulifera]
MMLDNKKDNSADMNSTNKKKISNNNSPLTIPEILELVLLHVLLQFQTSTHTHHHPFASSSSSPATSVSSSSSLTTTADTQRLAFLRVCRLWFQVGEPLLWKDVKLADYQHPQVHRRIWGHWERVRSLVFEYGMRTTDTELPSSVVVNNTSHSVLSAAAATSNTAHNLVPSVPPPTGANSTLTWTNGPRARMRQLLGNDTSAATGSTGSTTAAAAGSRNYIANTVSASSTGINHDHREPVNDNDINAHLDESLRVPVGQPWITLERALEELAKAMSRPTELPHYRPTPLPLTKVFNEMFSESRGNPTFPLNLPVFPPVLHRSQLTSLTLTGLFRLETFLEKILPFVPELTYLDISLRCYEWRDEIRLDKVLRSCPKLEYLSVDRNMIGRVEFSDLSLSDEEQDLDNRYDDYDPEYDFDDLGTGESDEVYSGTPWHLRFAENQLQESSVNGETEGDATGSNGLKQIERQCLARRRRPRPLALRVLKLKKVRILEQGFVQLIKRCPLLEEMDVFSTIYWSWSPKFLKTVAQSCAGLRHLHLTTNYDTDGLENHSGGTMYAGMVIIHDPLPDHHHSLTLPSPGIAGGPLNDGLFAVPASSAMHGQDLSTSLSPSLPRPSPYDPVVELIKLFPALHSYDARYVRFQDRALMTLQQTCRHLERLDLTSCREVTSKAVDRFLRHMPTLKHFTGSRILLKIEDLIEAADEHHRAVAVNASAAADDAATTVAPPQPLWWACNDLETFIIGVKNPTPPGSQPRENDLQAEQTADYQFYYRDYQGGPSTVTTAAASGATHRSGSGSRGAGTATIPPERPYDHTQYCTFVLFQQLGRLRRLRRVELHGGRFDLGVGINYHQLSPSSSLMTVPGSPSSDRVNLSSPGGSEGGFWHDREMVYGESGKQTGGGGSGSIARRGLSRVTSFLTLSGAVGGKGKQKSTSVDGETYHTAITATTQDLKGKEKVKSPKGKHVAFTVLDSNRPGNGAGSENFGSMEDDSNDGDFVYRAPSGANIGSYDTVNNNGNNDNSNRIVPSHLTGLQPLAKLKHLESFSMAWSNFPMLREQEMAWICQSWTSLKWISLGLVPDGEWDQIRSWVRSRRSDITVVFER